MGLISNKVDKSQIQPGDHIYTYRKLHTYSHHGICVEADRVIHYNRTQVANKKLWMIGNTKCNNCGHHPKMARGVIKTCVDCFLHGHGLYRFEYDVSYHHFVVKMPGTCTTGPSDSVDDSIRRANDMLNDMLNSNKGFGDYNLFENNCESFAMYCKTNKRMSEQAVSAMSFAKIAVRDLVKHNVDRLLHDVSVHNPNKHMQLKQAIETLITSSTLAYKEIIANLKMLNAKDIIQDDDQDDVDDEDAKDSI